MAYEEMELKEEASRCLLCENASCSRACHDGTDVASVIRSVRFENYAGALAGIKVRDSGQEQAATEACVRNEIDEPVHISHIFDCIERLAADGDISTADSRADLSVTSMGVKFVNPFLLSSSVVGSNEEMISKAFDMGWAGVAGKTIGLFTPDEVSPRFSALEKESNPFIGFKNIEQISTHPLEENLRFISDLKNKYPDRVFIASIMGSTEKEWTKLATLVEEAGADIIECNFSCPQMVGENLGSDVGTNPELVRAFTRAVRRGTTLPILAKMTPNITDMTVPAKAAIEGGATGIAAINTIKSVMNVDPGSFVSEPAVSGRSCVGGYSGKAVKPIALRFISDIARDPDLKDVPLSGMGGIESWKDALEFLACGCETVQVTTAVMQYGYRIIDDLIDGLSRYMNENHFSHIDQIVGRAVPEIVGTDELDRKTIDYPRFNRSLCVGCGRCYVSCYDGGHQAIEMSEVPRLRADKCVGCHLCRLVCPVGAITPGTRVVPRFQAV